MKILILSTVLLIGNALAKDLPPVQAPRELTEANSEYAEGTITRLSADDISVFVPYTQNAKSVLSKALTDSESMPMEQRVKHLTAIMKSVVKGSGQKTYQTFMRFALNRTLLLVKELVSQSDWKTPGTIENVLDLQVRGIELALRFYESDLAYQQRANREEDTVVLNHGEFATIFGNTMLVSTQNVLDASAQYRLLYKILEMMNWDLSRDQYAAGVADTIVEIYNTLYSMDENPAPADQDNILNIRRLNLLLGPAKQAENILIGLKSQRINENNQRLKNESEAGRLRVEAMEKEARRRRFQLSVGQSVMIPPASTSYRPVTGTVHEIRENDVVLKISDAKFSTFSRDSISFVTGCLNGICVGDVIYQQNASFTPQTILAITQFDTFITEQTGSTSSYRWNGSLTSKDFVKMKGCEQDICVGNKIFVLSSQKKATVMAITLSGLYVYTVDGLTSRSSTNRENITKIEN